MDPAVPVPQTPEQALSPRKSKYRSEVGEEPEGRPARKRETTSSKDPIHRRPRHEGSLLAFRMEFLLSRWRNGLPHGP